MVCPTTAFATWDSMNWCVVLSFIRCGDNETVREVVAQWVTGSAVPFVKKIVRGGSPISTIDAANPEGGVWVWTGQG